MGESVGVLVALSAGLFSFLSPCVLPLFPSYLSFITGMSLSALTGELAPAARRRVLLNSLAFVLGFSMLVFLANLVYSLLIARTRAEPNPWHSTSIEWQTTSPPPAHNFDRTPVIGDPHDYGVAPAESRP